MHQPTPLTPLAWDLLQHKRAGMMRGADATGRYMSTEMFSANGYAFTRAIPPLDGELELLELVAARDTERRLGQLLMLWEEQYRPEVEALTRSLREWAQPGNSLVDLVHRFDEVNAVAARLGELHTLSFGMTGLAMQRFEDFCVSELGEVGAEIARDAAAGQPNKSIESAAALWGLSREALARTAVAQLLADTTATEFAEGLDAVEGGAEFHALLDEFLVVYGQRNESFSELVFPTWREDPRFVMFTLRSYAGLPDDQSPTAMHERTIARRIERTDEARGQLSPAKFREFLDAQRIAWQRTILLEDHNYYIDQRGFSTLRMPCLAIGERLRTAGVIDAADDVFYMYRADIVRASADRSTKFQSTVRERREQRERWLRTLPPNVIGEGNIQTNPQMEAFLGPIEPEPAELGIVRGQAASPGVVRGTARVVRTLAEVEKLQAGDVLVTYATAPPWTPLFAVASAIITDAGGPTSHAAIVAREFGITAVVGTKSATARIEDGMVVTVDGNTGLVSIER